MAVSSTQLLRVIQQFRRYYDRHFSELLSRTGLSMREMHVVLFWPIIRHMTLPGT